MERPAVYCLVVSEHNVSELECCITLKPVVTILIASQRFMAAAQRFAHSLNTRLPDCSVLIPTNENLPLIGDTFSNCDHWIAQVLTPALQELKTLNQHEESLWYLNVTGGTKAIALALSRLHYWHVWHYKAYDKAYIEHIDRIDTTRPTQQIALQPISAKEYCELYTPFSDSPITFDSGRLALAEWMWDNRCQDAGVIALCDYLRKQPLPNRRGSMQRITLADLGVNRECMAALAQACAEHWPERLYINDDSIDVFIDQWFYGGWLEDQIQSWLQKWCLQNAYGENALLRDVRITNADNSHKAELDFVVYHRCQAFVIEAKADIDKSGPLVKQLSLQSIQLGKKHLAVLVGPDVSTHPQKLDQLRSTLGNNQISLLTNQSDLINFLELRNP
jgi:hypothetical protein